MQKQIAIGIQEYLHCFYLVRGTVRREFRGALGMF